MADAAAVIRASEIVPTAISLVLALAVVVHAVVVRRPAREALGWVSVVLVLLGFASVLPQSAWFFTFPLLVSVFPDGRFVPRWMVVPVAASFVLAAGEILSDGAWSEHRSGPGSALARWCSFWHRSIATADGRRPANGRPCAGSSSAPC